jgi:hypothetical protein
LSDSSEKLANRQKRVDNTRAKLESVRRGPRKRKAAA